MSENRETRLGQNRPIKIVQFLPEPKTTFRPDIAALFGIYLPRNGIECEFVSAYQQHSVVSAGKPGKVAPRSIISKLNKLGDFGLRCVRRLMLLNRSNCDLIQVRDLPSVGLLALGFARLKRIRFCFWMSFLMSEARITLARDRLREKFSFFQCLVLAKGLLEEFFLYRLVLPAADHVFVQSEAMAKYIQSRGIPAEKVTAVPMGVDTEQFAIQKQGSADMVRSDSAPVLIYLGTMIASRKIETLIDTLQLVQKTYAGAHLLLIGSSDSASGDQALLDYAAAKGLQGQVRITGWLPTAEAWRLLLQGDVAMSWIPRTLFHDVSSPTKLLEYLAAGVPCVANDIPDQVEVLEQSQAGWIAESNPESMSRAVLEILDNRNAARTKAAAGPVYIEAQRSYRILSDKVAREYRRIVTG